MGNTGSRFRVNGSGLTSNLLTRAEAQRRGEFNSRKKAQKAQRKMVQGLRFAVIGFTINLLYFFQPSSVNVYQCISSIVYRKLSTCNDY